MIQWIKDHSFKTFMIVVVAATLTFYVLTLIFPSINGEIVNGCNRLGCFK